MENNKSLWTSILHVPSDVSISAFAEYEGKIFAAGGSLNGNDANSCVKLYWSKDNGVTWTEISDVPTDLSFASALIIIDGKIFIAGRRGKCQQQWEGAMYSCCINDIIK